MRVDFFIAGVQKGGTTALDAYLRAHPRIAMAARKEAHFFDDEGVDWARPDYGQYHRLFATDAPGLLRGEATPSYCYWPQAIERLREYNPAAKVILCLRHPALRAFSHWRMEKKRGADIMPFGEAIRDRGRARVADAPLGTHLIYSYVERGFYAPQIERLLRSFPRERLHFLRTDELWGHPHATLKGVHEFLDVEPRVQEERRYVVSVDSRGTSELEEVDRKYLLALYRDDILRTSQLSGIDLGDWLRRDYREPMAG